MTDPDSDGSRSWNGVFPSLAQWRALAWYVVTPARSGRYPERVNAWRVSVGREPYTPGEMESYREMLGVPRARQY